MTYKTFVQGLWRFWNRKPKAYDLPEDTVGIGTRSPSIKFTVVPEVEMGEKEKMRITANGTIFFKGADGNAYAIGEPIDESGRY
jgi:hypothetical protein